MRKFLPFGIVGFTSLLAFNSHAQLCETTALESGLDMPSKIITCDFNGDGHEDIVYLNNDNFDLEWKRNTGSDTFNPGAALVGDAEITFLLAADLNDDGADEIIITTSSTIYYIMYTGPGSIDFGDLYTIPVLYQIDAIAAGDFDKDGYDGLVVGYSRTSTLHAMVDVINNDGGELSLQNIYEGTSGFISDIAVGDITGNGRVDIAMAGYSNFWFRNNGVGTFNPYTIISSASGDYGRIAIHDYDNDDDAELLVLDTDGRLLGYGIDITGGGWLYDPITLRSGLPEDPLSFQLTSLDGNDVLLITSSSEIIGLENVGATFTEETYCESIPNLYGAALFHKEDGLIEIIFTKVTAGTIEKMDEPKTNSVGEDQLANWSIYPNPASDIITIENYDATLINGVQILNLMGQEIASEISYNGQISIGDLAPGMYKLILLKDSKIISAKTFVKR